MQLIASTQRLKNFAFRTWMLFNLWWQGHMESQGQSFIKYLFISKFVEGIANLFLKSVLNAKWDRLSHKGREQTCNYDIMPQKFTWLGMRLNKAFYQ